MEMLDSLFIFLRVCAFLSCFRSHKEGKEPLPAPVQNPSPEPVPPHVSECLSPWTRGGATQVSAPLTESEDMCQRHII